MSELYLTMNVILFGVDHYSNSSRTTNPRDANAILILQEFDLCQYCSLNCFLQYGRLFRFCQTPLQRRMLELTFYLNTFSDGCMREYGFLPLEISNSLMCNHQIVRKLSVRHIFHFNCK